MGIICRLLIVSSLPWFLPMILFVLFSQVLSKHKKQQPPVCPSTSPSSCNNSSSGRGGVSASPRPLGDLVDRFGLLVLSPIYEVVSHDTPEYLVLSNMSVSELFPDVLNAQVMLGDTEAPLSKIDIFDHDGPGGGISGNVNPFGLSAAMLAEACGPFSVCDDSYTIDTLAALTNPNFLHETGRVPDMMAVDESFVF